MGLWTSRPEDWLHMLLERLLEIPRLGTGSITVTGAGSMLDINSSTNSAVFYVGALGNGTLNVLDGGEASGLDASIGFLEGSTGTVNIEGADSVWNNSGDVYVGGSATEAGGNGTICISEGDLIVGGHADSLGPGFGYFEIGHLDRKRVGLVCTRVEPRSLRWNA